MNDEAALTPGGVEGAVGMLAVALRNRMEVDRYVADEPGIDDVHRSSRRSSSPGCPGRAPPTSSTSSTRTPGCACCARGKAIGRCRHRRPTPRRCSGGSRRASRTRAARARRRAGRSTRSTSPTSTGPQECLAILDQTFVNPGLLWTMSVVGLPRLPAAHADLRAAYEYHARVLKLLQWGAPDAPVDPEVAVPPARARRHRRACTPTPASW